MDAGLPVAASLSTMSAPETRDVRPMVGYSARTGRHVDRDLVNGRQQPFHLKHIENEKSKEADMLNTVDGSPASPDTALDYKPNPHRKYRRTIGVTPTTIRNTTAVGSETTG